MDCIYRLMGVVSRCRQVGLNINDLQIVAKLLQVSENQSRDYLIHQDWLWMARIPFLDALAGIERLKQAGLIGSYQVIQGLSPTQSDIVVTDLKNLQCVDFRPERLAEEKSLPVSGPSN